VGAAAVYLCIYIYVQVAALVCICLCNGIGATQARALLLGTCIYMFMYT